MEVSGDLESLVCPLLGHGVRELAEDLLTLGQLDVRLLQRLRPEEHLPSEDQRRQECRYRILRRHGLNEDCKREAEDAESQVANQEVANIPDGELPEHFPSRNP